MQGKLLYYLPPVPPVPNIIYVGRATASLNTCQHIEVNAPHALLNEQLNCTLPPMIQGRVLRDTAVTRTDRTAQGLNKKRHTRGRGQATKQDGRLERELRAEAVPEGRRGREDSRTTHRVRCPSTPTTAATRNHVRGPRRSGTQGRKLATRPRPIRPGKRGGVASSEDRGRRARSGKEQAEQAAGTAGAVMTRIYLPTTPTNTRGPSPPHRETGRRSKGVRPLRQPGEKPKERSKLTDMEDRSRRDNIRILGIPENEEGSDMQTFLTSTLPKMISLDFDPPLEFQRAHRIGPKRSDNSSSPAQSSHACCGIIKPDKYSK
ncbi:hypothetical protein NDU88_003342 [Pleurodeles waltl]|uniref:Uncharacterized protein n=1 Tax=Pleurodeles waltl TaxID=8319 RepID=A0AAV7RGI4_PLEWA|nr:hypothetical protein NDU88_003342 [Pleurodeles waltl]